MICADRWNEIWNCTTDSGQPFAFKIDFRSNPDTRFCIKSADGCVQQNPSQAPSSLTPEQTSAITIQVYEWLEQIATSSCNPN